MQFQYLEELKKEFKKYSGPFVPAQIRTPCIEAIEFLSNPEMCLPIDSSENPILLAFLAILSNKKATKSSYPLLSSICNCANSETITGDALFRFVEILEPSVRFVDIDSCLKIIQFATSTIGSHFLDIHFFHSILSIILSLTEIENESVHASSIAASNQIILSFLDFSVNKESVLTPPIIQDIDATFSKSCQSKIEFEFHLHKIIYLILYDLVSLSNSESPSWLHVKSLNLSDSFALLDSIVLQKGSILKTSQNFLELVSQSLTSCFKNTGPLMYAINVSTQYVDLIPNSISTLFSCFLVGLTPHSNTAQRSLQFFRTYLMKNNSLIKFAAFCDPNGTLISRLIKLLLSFCQDFAEHQPISNLSPQSSSPSQFSETSHSEPQQIKLSLNSKISDQSLTDLSVTAPIEIAVSSLQACFQSDDRQLQLTLVSLIWSDVLVIISLALSFVASESSYVLLQGLHLLIVISDELDLDDARGAAIGSICTVLMSRKKDEEVNEIQRTALNTLTTAIDSSPKSFKHHWSKIITALSEFNWSPQSLSFSHSLDAPQLVEFSTALVQLNDGDLQIRKWALNLLDLILIENKKRLSDIWGKIEDSFIELGCPPFILPEYENITLSAFDKLLHEALCPESEATLCETIKRWMTYTTTPLIENKTVQKSLSHSRNNSGVFISNLSRHESESLLVNGGPSIETRTHLLNEMHALIAQNGSTISSGWRFLIDAISPDNYIEQIDLLNLAFRCLQIICNDFLFTLNEEMQMKVIESIFSFAQQITDINISLSAFGLLWNIITVAKISEMWIKIFSGIVELIPDERPDVSGCAVKTFFSLVVSNANSLPKDIFSYLVNDCFCIIIDFLANPKDDNSATQELAFHELAHCGRSLWADFASFTEEQWRRLIQEHEKFMLTITVRDSLVKGFQFYEEVLKCKGFSKELRTELFDSLDKLVQYFIEKENPNSVIFGAFGRLIYITLPEDRETLTVETMKRWLYLIESLIFGLKVDKFLPPTTHKTLDALDALFPLDDSITILIYESLVKMASNTTNTRLREVSMTHLVRLCEEKVNPSLIPRLFIMSESIFPFVEARKLLLYFVSHDIEIQDDMVSNVSLSLIELSRTDPELTKKAGTSLIKLFPRLDDELQFKVVQTQENVFPTISNLWTKYFDPESETFLKNSALKLTKLVVDSIAKYLKTINNEDDNQMIIQILQFILESKTYGVVFGKDENIRFAHLFYLIPVIADFVMYKDENIRDVVRKILLVIAIEK